MAIPKKVIETGAKTAGEVARKAYAAGYGKGFIQGANWVGKQIGPIGGKMIRAVTENGLPNAELRSVASKILHICKKIKHL